MDGRALALALRRGRPVVQRRRVGAAGHLRRRHPGRAGPRRAHGRARRRASRRRREDLHRRARIVRRRAHGRSRYRTDRPVADQPALAPGRRAGRSPCVPRRHDQPPVAPPARGEAAGAPLHRRGHLPGRQAAQRPPAPGSAVGPRPLRIDGRRAASLPVRGAQCIEAGRRHLHIQARRARRSSCSLSSSDSSHCTRRCPRCRRCARRPLRR